MQYILIDKKIKPSIFSKRILKNSFYTGLALLFAGIITPLFNFIIARFFGQEVLGEFNIMISFCLIITIFVTNFFGSAGNKFLAEYRGKNSYNQFVYVLKIVIFGPIIILLLLNTILLIKWDYFSKNFSLPYELFIKIIFYIFFRSFYIIFRRIYYSVDLVSIYAKIEIISDIVLFLAIILVAFKGKTTLLLDCYIYGYATFVIISIILLLKNYQTITKNMSYLDNFNKNDIMKKFSHYGIVSMVGTVASTGTGYLSILVIGMYLSQSDAGLYSSVLAIVSILMFIPKLFTQVFLPEISNLFGAKKNKEITQLFYQTSKIMISLSAALCTIVYLISSDILNLFGEEFVKGSIILQLLLPSVFIRITSIPFVSFLSGTKYIIYPNIGGVIIFFVSLISWVILVPNYSLLGVAIGYTIGNITGVSYQILMAYLKIKSFANG